MKISEDSTEKKNRMIDFKTARAIAQHFLDNEMRPSGDRYVILDKQVSECWEAWYFPYQSERFLLTGERTRFVITGVAVAVRKDGGMK